MAVQLHLWAAALYLAAGVVAWLGMALRAGRLERASAAVLLAGAVFHVASFAVLHELEPPPPLTDLPAAVSFMACVGTLFFLALLRRWRLAGLTVLVAPLAFVSVFFAALRLPEAGPASFDGSGSWPHAHVLLASAGLALLAVGAIAGAVFLVENRRLKRKRIHAAGRSGPSLEALDRVAATALSVGFPLLTLGVVTGMAWLYEAGRGLWTGSAHESWNAIAWGIYALLVAARFGAHQGARDAAASAVAGFVFLLFAVVGVGMLA